MPRVFFVSAIFFLTSCSGSTPRADAPATPIEFGGAYTDLEPAQRKLVVDWFERYDEITGEHLDPAIGYGELPLSTRTTFDAVTDALMTTELTDKDGASLGTALELVRMVETVHGQIRGTSGDHQFRIYADLTSDAMERLEKSQQFRRRADNTVYHLDYPINFRQDGVPSIQFSIARDGLRTDIDVDYRSSAFPVLLFDGHLTAANSDVRAGDNYERHSGRWSGFVSWWRNIFGIPIAETEYQPETRPSFANFDTTPRIRSTEPVAVAVEDFLSSWLVQRMPERAVAYFSQKSYACVLELEPGSTDTVMAPLRIARDMREVNLAVGTIVDLDEALNGVMPADLEAHQLRHAYDNEFTLLELPPSAVEGLECHDPASPLPPWHENRDQKFYGASMHLVMDEAEGLDLFQIWTAEEGRWKIVAFHTDVHADTSAVLGARAPKAVEREERPADADFAEAVDTFLETWLIERRYDDTLSWISERAFACVALYNDPEELERFDGADELFRQRLEEVSRFVGTPERLDQALASIVPWDPDLHVLGHDQGDAYTLLSVNDYIAEQLDCRHRSAHGLYVSERERSHGTHFAAMFQLRRAGEHAPVLTLLWAQEDGAWKVISYHVAIP